MSDRLALANAIVDAGIERAKAERVASTIVALIYDEVATRADIAAVRTDLKADVAAVSADLRRTESALMANVAAVRADLHATETRLKGEIALVEHRLLTRLGGLIIVATGIIMIGLRYLPPMH